jgi:hypothetical protein
VSREAITDGAVKSGEAIFPVSGSPDGMRTARAAALELDDHPLQHVYGSGGMVLGHLLGSIDALAGISVMNRRRWPSIVPESSHFAR